VTYRICLVCLGNICRSPMAAAVLKSRLDKAGLTDRVTVESAGTGSWHIDEPADPRALGALRERGYDGTAHRARQFVAQWFADYDLVLAMDRDNFADLHRLAPDDPAREKIQLMRSYDPSAKATGELDVPDPYYGGADGFAHVLNQVERAADGLVDALQEELGDRGAAGPADRDDGGDR
jgi:protein-tyrosine phosphatase